MPAPGIAQGRRWGFFMSFWAAAQLQPQRDGLAALCLRQAGFEIYVARLREPRTAHGRKVDRTPLLFPGYLFVFIRLQWHTAGWAPGVVRLVMDGTAPAVVPDGVIMALQARETGGLIDLPGPRNSTQATACKSHAAPLPGTSACMPG